MTAFPTQPIQTLETEPKRTPQENQLWANQLFLRLGAIYGRKFTTQYSCAKAMEMAKHEWSMAILDFSGQEIKSALDKLRAAGSKFVKWPPTIGEFVRLVKDEQEVPSEIVAFDQALREEFTHAAVYHAYKRIGEWGFKHKPEKELRTLFYAQYADSLHRMRNGELLTMPILKKDLLPSFYDPKKLPAVTPEVQQEEMEKIKKMLSR